MIPRAYWLDDSTPGNPGALIYTSKRTAPGVWSTKSLAYSVLTNPPVNPPGHDPSMGIQGFSASTIPDVNDDPNILLLLDDMGALNLNVYSLVTGNPPAPVDVDVAWAIKDYWSISEGSWFSNGFWWTIQNVDLLAAPTRLRVYRSLDRLTWIAMDVANEPLPWYGFISWAIDGDYHPDGKIHCIYSPALGNLNWWLVEFDMATGTWGAPHDMVALPAGPPPTTPRVLTINWSATTGDVFILYHYNRFGWHIAPFDGLGLHYGFLVGAVWTVEIFIDPIIPCGASTNIQALLDPDGVTLHYIFGSCGPISSGYYRRISLGGLVSNSHTFPVNDALGYSGFCGHSILDPATGTILIPTPEKIAPAVGSEVRPSAWVGTPLAAPVWTLENIDPDQMIQAPAMFLGFGAEPPAPAPVAPVMQGGSRRMHVLVPNLFDHCLQNELDLHRKYRPQKACCDVSLYYDITWVRAPKSAIPFRKTGTVPTPLAAAGDVTVLDFQVPVGYDGIIAGLFGVYTGPGFLEGNGDIVWRLIVNRVYAIHLGQVLVTLGSQQVPYPALGGIPIQSGNRIRYVVNVPNLSGGILPLASEIVCGLEGLFYARQ